MNMPAFLTGRRSCARRAHFNELDERMNVFADFQSRIAAMLEKRVAAGELPRDLDLGRFAVEPPRDAAHGDLSTNAAMVYARETKAAGSSPRALAETLAGELAREPD